MWTTIILICLLSSPCLAFRRQTPGEAHRDLQTAVVGSRLLHVNGEPSEAPADESEDEDGDEDEEEMQPEDDDSHSEFVQDASDHERAEADSARAAELEKERDRSYGVRIFSDIDDTMICSHSKALHGTDTNCGAKGDVYPGMTGLFLQMAMGTKNANGVDPPLPVPLSTRPEKLRFLLAIKEEDPLNMEFVNVAKPFNITFGMDLQGALYGAATTLFSVASGQFETSLSPVKFKGWKKYNTTYPTVFFGDNGQGDVYAAMLMRQFSDSSSVGPRLNAAFIHHVQMKGMKDPALTTSKKSTRPGDVRTLRAQRIFLFENYAEAACIAFKEDLITADGYRAVMMRILTECTSNEPYSFVSKQCRVLLPEFNVTGPYPAGPVAFKIRPADSCDEPHHEFPSPFEALTPVLSSQSGWPFVGKCGKLSPGVLQAVGEVHRWYAAQKHLPPKLRWAAQFGFRCASTCKSTCEVARKQALKNMGGAGPSFTLRDGGSRITPNCGWRMGRGKSGRALCKILPEGVVDSPVYPEVLEAFRAGSFRGLSDADIAAEHF